VKHDQTLRGSSTAKAVPSFKVLEVLEVLEVLKVLVMMG